MGETWERDGYEVSTDPGRLDVDVIHGYLSRSYWAANRTREVVEKSLAHSMCFGLYFDGAQVGLARVVTDRATFAYLCDVYVLEEHRGRGLSKWMMSIVRGHAELSGLRRWMLATADAHGLYRQYGFTELGKLERWMEIVDDTK